MYYKFVKEKIVLNVIQICSFVDIEVKTELISVGLGEFTKLWINI